MIVAKRQEVDPLSDSALRKDIWSILGVITALSVLSAGAVLTLTEQALANQKQEILEQKLTTAGVLAGRFQLRIEDATNALEVAGKNGEFSEVDNADMVSEQYKGIPIGLEEGKRKVARDIIEEYRIFETIAFVLPNGDIYFVEPYDRQLSLPRLNYADREWYRGPIETGMPYAADALVSTATNNRVIPIAVPLYSSDRSLTGMLVAAMSLEQLESQLRMELNLSENNRVAYVDDKGNAIVDLSSTSSDTYTDIIPLGHLQSVKNVIGGETGHVVEEVDNVEMLTVYRPANIGGRNWGVLVMQPVSGAYSAIDYMRNQVYTMLAIILAITAGCGYFLVSFRVNSSLARELAKTNKELVEKDKFKDEFLKIASHELRTPIQPILGFSALGAQGKIKDQVAWNIVHKEAQRLMKLANNIFDITMIQSGMMSYKMEEVNIIDVIHSSADSIKTSAKDKNLSLELNLDERCQNIEIHADRSRLERVLDELLENAVKFTEKGSVHLECSLESDTQELRITVSDTGTSIPTDNLPRIFDLFVSKSVNDPTIQGAGLGLFICRAIIKAHGGTITARNNIGAAGAAFEVRLPMQTSPQHGLTTKSAAA